MTIQTTQGHQTPATEHSRADCLETAVPKPRKADRRVEKTKRALLQALVEVMVEKGYEAGSVADIVERADVGRSTFYAHYADKEDLLSESMTGLKTYLLHASMLRRADQAIVHPALEFVRPMLEHVQEMRVLFRALASRPNDSAVQKQLHLMLSELVRERLSEVELPGSTALVAEFVVGAFLAVCFWWMNGNDHLPASDVERAIVDLLAPALSRA